MSALQKWLLFGGLGLAIIIGVVIIWFLWPKPTLEPQISVKYSPTREITIDTVVDFSCSASLPGVPTRSVRYQWDFGDGSSGTGKQTTHQYEEEGTYDATCTAEVTDRSGKIYIASQNTTVSVELPPLPELVAKFDYSPSQPSINKPVVFNASTSTSATPFSPSIRPQWEYIWNIGGTSLTGQRVEHLFTQLGEFPVTLTVRVRDQFNRVTKPARTEKRITVTIPPEAVQVSAKPNGPNEEYAFVTGIPVEFSVAVDKEFDDSNLIFQWDFDNDGTIEVNGPARTIPWEFIKEGAYTIIVRIPELRLEKTLEVIVKAIPPPPPPPFGPFVASGGMGVIGELRLWNVAAGMNIPNTNVDILVGYGSNMSTTTIERTSQEVKNTFKDALVTTVIESATLLSVSIYYPVHPSVYAGAGLGYLTLSGEHRSNHPRVLVNGKQDAVSFHRSYLVFTFGVAYKLGFALISLQLGYVP